MLLNRLATKSQIISFGVIPQILPAFIAKNLYILDRNVGMATMLGIVGAGGLIMNYNLHLECLSIKKFRQ